jgi:hypothetical protein
MLLDDLEDDAVSALYQVRGACRRSARCHRPLCALPQGGRWRPHPSRAAAPASQRVLPIAQVGPYVIQIKQRPGEGRVLDKELEDKQEQVQQAGCRPRAAGRARSSATRFQCR